MGVFWRLVRDARAANPLSGEGARLFGGRWNEVGVSVIYTSASRSLAALEVLVHLGGIYPDKRYKFVSYEVEDRLILEIPRLEIPHDWQEEPPSPSTARWGSTWAKEKRSVAVAVPSTVIPEEKNIILNPDHPDMRKVKLLATTAFAFDPRLFSPASKR